MNCYKCNQPLPRFAYHDTCESCLCNHNITPRPVPHQFLCKKLIQIIVDVMEKRDIEFNAFCNIIKNYLIMIRINSHPYNLPKKSYRQIEKFLSQLEDHKFAYDDESLYVNRPPEEILITYDVNPSYNEIQRLCQKIIKFLTRHSNPNLISSRSGIVRRIKNFVNIY